MTRPAVSQHLRVLTDAGLLEVRGGGNKRLYRSRPEGLRDAAAFLEEMWADNLAAQAARPSARSGRSEPARRRESDRDRRRSWCGRADAADQCASRDRGRTGPIRRACACGGRPRPSSTRGPAGPVESTRRVAGSCRASSSSWCRRATRVHVRVGADRGACSAAASMRVEVRFVADAGDTIMTLRHSGIPASEAGRHNEGWDYFLPLLVDVVQLRCIPIRAAIPLAPLDLGAQGVEALLPRTHGRARATRPRRAAARREACRSGARRRLARDVHDPSSAQRTLRCCDTPGCEMPDLRVARSRCPRPIRARPRSAARGSDDRTGSPRTSNVCTSSAV